LFQPLQVATWHAQNKLEAASEHAIDRAKATAKAAAAAAPRIAADVSQQATVLGAKATHSATAGAAAAQSVVQKADPSRRMRQARNWALFLLFGGLFAYAAGKQVPYVLKDIYFEGRNLSKERAKEQGQTQQAAQESAPAGEVPQAQGWGGWAKAQLGL